VINAATVGAEIKLLWHR